MTLFALTLHALIPPTATGLALLAALPFVDIGRAPK